MGVEPEFQLVSLLAWLALLLFLQLSVWPSLRPALREFAYPVSFPFSLLAFTLISWYCGLFHLPVQAAFAPFIIMFAYFAMRREYARSSFSGQWRWILVFLIFFVFMLELRFVNPSISYAEKFMDHAFLGSIMRVPVVPPLDPWFAGGFLNVYYYLGYWMFGALGVVTTIPSPVVFNLALPTVLANAAVSLYALAHLLTPRLRWLPLLTLLVVNPSFLWNLFQGKGLGSVLWDSTRTIPNAINEYPIFSFVWGDLHAHVISLFNQVFLLFILVSALLSWKDAGRNERMVMIGLAALSLGSMPLINSWDVILYAPVTVVFGLLIWYYGRSDAPPPPREENMASRRQGSGRVPGNSLLAKDWSFLFCVPLLSVLIYAPFYFQMTSRGIQGVGLVHTPTPVFAFLLVHGIFIVLFLVALYRDILKCPLLLLTPIPFALAGYAAAGIAALPLAYFLAKRKRYPADLLAIFGLTVIILCEFLYLKDNMGEVYFRMNTVFKFYLPAWILMGSAGFSMTATVLTPLVSHRELPRNLRLGLLAGAIALLLISPLVISFEYQYRDTTLDGLAYLSSTHPGDAEAVAFLRSLDGVTAIVEAEGGDYTYYSRISSFTGIPTIIGMPFHEFMWRANGWFWERTNDVRLIYEEPGQTLTLMKKYNATHLYVGDAERERYNVRVEEAGLPLLYERSGVQVYQIST